MLELSNVNQQTIQPGETITFDRVLFKNSCCNITKSGNGPVRINGVGSYEITFHGNVNGALNLPLILAITDDGATLAETTMLAMTAAAAQWNNVSAGTVIGKKCKCTGSSAIAVKNIGVNAITLYPGSALIIKEV